MNAAVHEEGAVPDVPLHREDVLYLDFDGVLHPESVYRFRTPPCIRLVNAMGHNLFESCPVLEQLLELYPDVRIVLSTSWVPNVGFQRARSRLTPGLQRRVIGATFHSRYHDAAAFLQGERHLQILDDVGRRQPSRWLAVDDATDLWPDWFVAYLAHMPGPFGLSQPIAQARLKQRLAEVFGSPPTQP